MNTAQISTDGTHQIVSMQRDLQFLLDMLQSAELILTYKAQCSTSFGMWFNLRYHL